MAVSCEVETIELSEAIRTLLDEDISPDKNKTSFRACTTPKVSVRSDGSPDLSEGSAQGQRNFTPNRSRAKQGSETPLSRKSSLLQRSLGSSYSGSASPKKRPHAHGVIILRPPKKRAMGSTPRITSTSRHTPASSSLGSKKSRHSLQTTPVSSLSRPRLNSPSVDGKDGKLQRKLGEEDYAGPLAATPDLSLMQHPMYFLEGALGGENLSAKERENLALQEQYLRLLEQQQRMMMGGAGGMEGLQDGGGQPLGQGGLSLDVSDQTGRISLIARGNQDDSLTNITWLRRMSAPDLDPVTLKQLKDPHRERPPYSYSALIQFAISSAPEGKLTLRDIYFWIETNFPYFRTAKLGWKNSIRHNLSLHKIFVREAPSGPGQPAFWTLRPGTVVRMPERKVHVHDEMAYRSSMQQDCLVAEGAVSVGMMGNPPAAGDPVNPLTGNNILVSDPQSMPMLPAQDSTGLNGTPVFTSTPVVTRPSGKGPKRVPPILPKGTPPYALVPLPIYFTTDPKTGQLVPANGDNMPPVGNTSSPALPNPSAEHSTRKIVPKAEKNTPTRRPHSKMEQSRTLIPVGKPTMDSGYGSTDSSLGDENVLSMMREHLSSKVKSEGKLGVGKENALSAEFDLGLDVADDLLKTPPKSVSLDWLSPIRGFTPGPESGFLKDVDFNFTPFKTGFTPNNRVGHSNTPRHLMLSPLNRNVPRGPTGGCSGRKARMITPKRYAQSDRDLMNSSLHNSSFEQIFGDVEFDVDPDNIDVGNMSWLLQSPPAK